MKGGWVFRHFRVVAVLVASLACALVEADQGGDSIELVSSHFGLTLKFSLDPDTGMYAISLRNDGEDTEVFADRFSDRSDYELIPGAVLLYLKINGKMVPNPLYYAGLPSRAFSPYYRPDNYIIWADYAQDICGSCVAERSFDLRHFVDHALRRTSKSFESLRRRQDRLRDRDLPERIRKELDLARELDFLSGIRMLEVKLLFGVQILSKELTISNETEWIELPVDEYAPAYLP